MSQLRHRVTSTTQAIFRLYPWDIATCMLMATLNSYTYGSGLLSTSSASSNSSPHRTSRLPITLSSCISDPVAARAVIPPPFSSYPPLSTRDSVSSSVPRSHLSSLRPGGYKRQLCVALFLGRREPYEGLACRDRRYRMASDGCACDMKGG